jgi:hypothetical protein
MQTIEFPYAGTSGWAGSDTSRERAEQQDQDGTYTARQRTAMYELLHSLDYGVTWRELALATGLHHGQASGLLSNLHKEGRIVRLTERRNKCAIYVLPEYTLGRETSEHGNTKAGSNQSKINQLLELHIPSEELIWDMETRKHREYCAECQYPWPCDTIKILNGGQE